MLMYPTIGLWFFLPSRIQDEEYAIFLFAAQVAVWYECDNNAFALNKSSVYLAGCCTTIRTYVEHTNNCTGIHTYI